MKTAKSPTTKSATAIVNRHSEATTNSALTCHVEIVSPAPPLPPHASEKLHHYEDAIESALRKSFIDVGNLLRVVKMEGLYRVRFGTFEKYVEERWHISRITAHRFIKAAECAEHMQPLMLPSGNIPMPIHEAQVRHLTNLDPQLAIKAWQMAYEESAGHPTEHHIKEIVDRLTGKSPGEINHVNGVKNDIPNYLSLIVVVLKKMIKSAERQDEVALEVGFAQLQTYIDRTMTSRKRGDGSD